MWVQSGHFLKRNRLFYWHNAGGAGNIRPPVRASETPRYGLEPEKSRFTNVQIPSRQIPSFLTENNLKCIISCDSPDVCLPKQLKLLFRKANLYVVFWPEVFS